MKEIIINPFDELSRRGATGLKDLLKEQDEKTLYKIQKTYFSSAIKKGKDKQIEYILRKMNYYLNLGWVFRDREYINYTEVE